MNDNVYKVLDRGEKIEVLVDKTESMQTQVMVYLALYCMLWGARREILQRHSRC